MTTDLGPVRATRKKKKKKKYGIYFVGHPLPGIEPGSPLPRSKSNNLDCSAPLGPTYILALLFLHFDGKRCLNAEKDYFNQGTSEHLYTGLNTQHLIEFSCNFYEF